MFTTFSGDNSGAWQVTSLAPVKGDALAPANEVTPIAHISARRQPGRIQR
jgi:hypothetical protein